MNTLLVLLLNVYPVQLHFISPPLPPTQECDLPVVMEVSRQDEGDIANAVEDGTNTWDSSLNLGDSDCHGGPADCRLTGQPCQFQNECGGWNGSYHCHYDPDLREFRDVCECFGTCDCTVEFHGFARPGCGVVNGTWNVPPDAAVVTHTSSNVISPIITAIGEYWDHIMLSLGPDGIVQANMRPPTIADLNGWPGVCTQPLPEDLIRHGYPGVEVVNLGAEYEDLPSSSDTSVKRWVAFHGCGQYSPTTAVMQTPYVSTPAQGDHWLGPTDIRRPLRSSALVPYSIFQFTAIEGTNQNPSWSTDGMVCSTFMSYAQALPSTSSLVIPAHRYEHAIVAPAILTMKNIIYNACRQEEGFFGHGIGAFLLGLACFGHDVCDDLADQVMNCFTADDCASSDNQIWYRHYLDSAFISYSLSPDAIIGRPPQHAESVSYWSHDSTVRPISWSVGGGIIYGCWE